MALVALEIPKVGLVMENSRLVRWLKNVGDTVKEGEPLLELETEKSVVEIEATVSGRLVEILLQPEAEAHVGDRIAWVDDGVGAKSGTTPAAVFSADSAPAVKSAPPTAGSAGAAGSQAPLSSAAKSNAASATVSSADAAANGRVRSSPVARRLASQHGVDLSRIAGTGPRGRIQLSDVRQAIELQSAQRAASPASTAPQPLTSMRRALARSMSLSNATVPQFPVTRAVDWTALQSVRPSLQSQLGTGAPKLSVNDFLLQAVARALLTYPTLNATFSGEADSPDARIIPASGAHIGLVVAVENGLLVPVFHGVDQLGIGEIARRRGEAVDRALKGRPKRDELEGATFSISNLGTRGPDRFTAIINPPQSAILAVGRQRDCVVAINGGIHVRPMSDLTLTVDHRVADGRLASDFLAYVVELLEGNTWKLK